MFLDLKIHSELNTQKKGRDVSQRDVLLKGHRPLIVELYVSPSNSKILLLSEGGMVKCLLIFTMLTRM